MQFRVTLVKRRSLNVTRFLYYTDKPLTLKLISKLFQKLFPSSLFNSQSNKKNLQKILLFLLLLFLNLQVQCGCRCVYLHLVMYYTMSLVSCWSLQTSSINFKIILQQTYFSLWIYRKQILSLIKNTSVLEKVVHSVSCVLEPLHSRKLL